MSTFERLFRYARPTEKRPLENFTTEILAAAIRSDPTPFFRALKADGTDDLVRDPARLTVETQRRFGEHGQPDLVIRVDEEVAWVVEVKVNAAESGDQLKNYASIPAAKHVYLTPAGKANARYIGLKWSAIQKYASECEEHTWWRELAIFLEWHGMVDLGVNKADELSGAIGSSMLIQRVLASLRRPIEQLRDLGHGTWPTEGRLRQQVLERFVSADEPGTISAQNSDAEAMGLCLGLHPTDGRLAARIWIWRNAERDPGGKVKDAIHFCSEALVRANVGWKEVADDWVLLEVLDPSIENHGAEELATWFSARVGELAQQGVLDIVLPRAIR